SPENLRLARRNLLEMLCMAAKLQFPEAQDVVGYATDPGPEAGRREEALYFDMRNWTEADRAEAERLREKLGLLKKLERFDNDFREYPTASAGNAKGRGRTPERKPRSMRNSPCPCGSGKKFKHCCYRR